MTTNAQTIGKDNEVKNVTSNVQTNKDVNPTSEKQIKDNKTSVIEKRKSQIKGEKNSLFENVDFLNLEKTIAKIKVVEKTEKKLMYSFERNVNDAKEQKKLRTKMRNIRNRFANNIILSFQKKDEKELKRFVKEFKEFYLKEYILNDYSLLSLSSNNRDKDTETLLNSMLQIISFVK